MNVIIITIYHIIALIRSSVKWWCVSMPKVDCYWTTWALAK